MPTPPTHTLPRHRLPFGAPPLLDGWEPEWLQREYILIFPSVFRVLAQDTKIHQDLLVSSMCAISHFYIILLNALDRGIWRHVEEKIWEH